MNRSYEREPKVFWCCCGAKIGATTVFIIECALCILALLAALVQVSEGKLSSCVSSFVAIVTLSCAIYVYQGVQQDAPHKLVPYLIWKPIQTIVEIGTLVYFIIYAPKAYKQALSTSMSERKIDQLSESDEKYLNTIFGGIYGTVVTILIGYFLMGLVFIYIVYRCRLYLIDKAGHLPLAGGQMYHVPVFVMPPGTTVDAPPAYSTVYKPTIEKKEKA